MPVLYALVSRGSVVLAEHAATSGNFVMVSRRILEKIPGQNGKMSYEYDKHVFHYIVEDEITYLCMTDAEFARRLAFAFLDDIKGRFKKTYADRAKSALAFAMNDDFGRVLKKQMDYYSNNPDSDRVTHVRGEIDEVKNIMFSNIEKVIDRGEKISLLVDKTETLNKQSHQFKKNSGSLRHAMWVKNMKLNCIIFSVVMVLLLIILVSICGIDFKKCK
jgi:vesicle-associated membrane protein 7